MECKKQILNTGEAKRSLGMRVKMEPREDSNALA
jgi:hypothetical protein